MFCAGNLHGHSFSFFFFFCFNAATGTQCCQWHGQTAGQRRTHANERRNEESGARVVNQREREKRERERERERQHRRNEKRLLKGAELKQQNEGEQRTGKPAQPASQPNSQLASRPIANREHHDARTRLSLLHENFRKLARAKLARLVRSVR